MNTNIHDQAEFEPGQINKGTEKTNVSTVLAELDRKGATASAKYI